MKAVRALRDVSGADFASVGSKAANLAELVHHGYRVPEGFVITTEVYARLLETDGSRSRIEALLAGVEGRGPDGLRAAAGQVQALVRAAQLARPCEPAIVEAYQGLGASSVAVRSSATAEDLPAASFAGQQASFLNIRGIEDLLSAVEGCWQSLFSERAIRYRHRQGFDHLAVRMAVLVQEMVAARAAGVAFSVNPTNGSREDVLIEAVCGLGEAAVAGEVTPDLYVVDKATMAPRRKIVNERTWGYYCDPARSGISRRPLAESAGPVLTDAELQEITATVRDIELHFRCPQDVEWAIDRDGALFVLQARPITGLARHLGTGDLLDVPPSRRE
jgi:phosphoenolpyruvate synthase/pyruvate phosphate dikinase